MATFREKKLTLTFHVSRQRIDKHINVVIVTHKGCKEFANLFTTISDEVAYCISQACGGRVQRPEGCRLQRGQDKGRDQLVAVYTVDKTELNLSRNDLIELVNVCSLLTCLLYTSPSPRD